MTLEEIAVIVDNEGLGYAIAHYMGSDDIEDPVLKEKWEQAGKLLREIEDMLPDM